MIITGKTCCAHGIPTESRCIECHLIATQNRMAKIESDNSKRASYEKEMLAKDIENLSAMLVIGRRTL